MMIAYLHSVLKWMMGVWNLALMIPKLIVAGYGRMMGFSMRAVVSRKR